VKKKEQITMLCFGLVGILGIQLGLYVLVQGLAYSKAYGMLFIGSFLTLTGFGRFKSIQEEEEKQDQ
jgi:predicted tellurium resistance membrane protein TerC